jgi:hypothetical protein
MNVFSNIWQHPKTSVAGVLIAVGTIAGLLAQTGVTLGRMGTGTVVSFVGALSAALLGLLARDPESQPAEGSSTAKLRAWMLIALLLAGTLPTAGCTGSSVAQDIVNWTPSLQSAVTAVDSIAATLDPGDLTVFSTATASFDALSNLFVVQAKAYLADPSAPTLLQVQNQIVALQQQVNTALLTVAKITNPTSQQHVIAAVQAVAAIVTAILALVQSVSSKSDIERMSAQSAVKLGRVEPLLHEGATVRIVAAHYNEPLPVAEQQMLRARAEMMRAGF